MINHLNFKIGYSINNPEVFSVEAVYLIPFHELIFDLSINGRIYSFSSITINDLSNSIQIISNVSLSLSAGIGVEPQIFLRIMGHSFGELSVLLKYKLNHNRNLLIEYKQIGIGEDEVLNTFSNITAKNIP